MRSSSSSLRSGASYGAQEESGTGSPWPRSAPGSSELQSSASGPVAIVAFDRSEGLSPDVQTALIESNGWSFVLTFAIDGAFLLAVGALAVATRVLPRWLGWSALLFGVLGLLSILGGLNGPPAILLFFVWILAASIYLLAGPRPTAA